MNNDLISRSALKEEFAKHEDRKGYLIGDWEDIIDNAPPAEPQKIVTIPPELIEKLVLCVVDTVENIDWEKAIEAYKARPQGHWIKDAGIAIKCSECNAMYAISIYDKCYDYLSLDYCPHCGADMRGDEV